MKRTAAAIRNTQKVCINVFTMLYKIVTLHSVCSLSHSGDYVNMVRRLLLDFLLKKHPLHTHKYAGDALFRPSRTLYNETRFKAVGSLN